MEIEMRLPEEKTYTPAPSGNFPAICISFIDCGTQETSFGYKRQIKLRWELPTEKMADLRPFTITQTYTWSMNAKSRFRQDLESWRGRPFRKEDFGSEGFDTRKLLGVACLLNIIHKESGDQTYANIQSISPIPKGMPAPGPASNKLTYFALEEGDFNETVLEEIPETLRAKIKASPEYQELKFGKTVDASEPADFSNPDLEDEIPF
jgi:hypothetical protein